MTDTQKKPFRLEEATINELHAAIRAGETTVVQIVEAATVPVGKRNGAPARTVPVASATLAPSSVTSRLATPL